MQQKARIYSLDIIRGIAILCILFANLPTMTGLDPFNQAGYSGTDKVIRLLIDLFIQAKFYTIFAFLFGVGFYIFIKMLKQKAILCISCLAVDCVSYYSLVYSTLYFYGMEIFYTHMP